MKQVEVQLIPLGKYVKDGKEFEVTPELVQCAVDYYEATRRANNQDLVFDYEHQSLTGEEAPAAGWIKQLVNLGKDGLGAIVEWTARAADYIKNKEYKYVSPVFVYEYEDERTGAKVPMVLFNAALTNVPFFPNIKEVVATWRPSSFYANAKPLESDNIVTLNNLLTIKGAKMDVGEMLKAVAVGAGLPESATPEEVLAQVKKITDFMKAIPPAAGAPEGATPEEGMEMMKDAVACRKDVAKLLKCDAKTETVLSEILKLTTTDKPKSENEELVALRREINAMKLNAEADQFILSNAKRIPPAQVEVIKEFYVGDKERTIRLVASMQELDLSTPIKKKEDEKKEIELTAQEKRIAARMGIDEATFLAGKKIDASLNNEDEEEG